MSKALLAPTFLFQFATSCRYRKELGAEGGIKLGEEHRLPSFGELEGRPLFADLRAAWNEEGLAFVLQVAGKQQAPWCRASRVEDSDGLQVFLNTRDAQNIHRASRFCHRFVFLPSGGGNRADQPVAEMVKINRAQQSPRAIRAGLLRVESAQREGGYTLHAFIPATALTG